MLSRFGGYLLSRLPVTSAASAHGSRSLSLGVSSNQEQGPKPAIRRVGFLEDKTGVTGPWIAGLGLTAVLISKEIYILNAETLLGAIAGTTLYFLVREIGKPTAEYLDNRAKGILDQLNEGRVSTIKQLEDTIKQEKSIAGMLEVRHEVFDILKENNDMRLSAEYYRRQHEVVREVKRRLDCELATETTVKKYQSNHLTQWLEREVMAAIWSKPDDGLNKCIADLKQLSAA